MTRHHRWDIFCRVVDNFGDIGVCWRLARQVQSEYPIQIRLWVDDLHSFQRICAEVDPSKASQTLLGGVEVIAWTEQAADKWIGDFAATAVVEAFGCDLPASYLAYMALGNAKPVWLNLEYLSAESWVEACHALPSPHPQLPLQKYFYFPGFTDKTGGVLRESALLQQVEQCNHDTLQQHDFLQSLGLERPSQGALILCLFAYRHAGLADWLDALAELEQPVLCLVPAGVLTVELQQMYPQLLLTSWLQKGQLRLQLLPSMDQPLFDRLLWCCDINFVRGEDSLIRAIWAGKPFIWQLYPQQDQVHLVKLEAFWQRYKASMPTELELALHRFWSAWNQQSDLLQPWLQLMRLLPSWQQHARHWRQQLSLQDDLAKNLVRFVEKKFILTAKFSK